MDLIRTFGKSSGTEIAKRYEQRIEDRKYRERMPKSRIGTPEQEKWMKKQRLERERKRAAELKTAGITEDQIEVEKRRLEDRLTHAKNIYEAQIIKEKTEELERDPALYFSKKRHSSNLIVIKSVGKPILNHIVPIGVHHQHTLTLMCLPLQSKFTDSLKAIFFTRTFRLQFHVKP